MAARGRKRQNYTRDRFFAMLMTVWQRLGLVIGVGDEYSCVRDFIQCASAGVLDEVPQAAAVRAVIIAWKPGIENEL